MRIALLAATASLFWLGCSDPSPGVPDGGPVDAIVTNVPDAADVTEADAAPDATPADWGTVTVTVNAHDLSETPLAGVPVVFSDATTVYAVGSSDAAGHASAIVPPGVSVTAIYDGPSGYGGGHILKTVSGAQPGDDIVLGMTLEDFQYEGAAGPSVGSFTVNVPRYWGAERYTLHGPCGSVGHLGFEGAAMTLPMSKGCVTPTMELIAVALDGSGVPLAYIRAADVPFVAGGEYTLFTSWGSLSTMTVDVTNVPPGAFGELAVDVSAPSPWSYATGRFAPRDASSATLTMPVPAASHLFMTTHLTSPGGLVKERVYERLEDGEAQHYSIDVAAARLPRVDEPWFVGFDRIRVPLPDGGDSDLFAAEIFFRRGEFGEPGFVGSSWQLWGPTPGDVQLPALPPQLAFGPSAGDIVSGTKVMLIDLDGASYDQLRQDVFGTFSAHSLGEVPGRMRVSIRGNYHSALVPAPE